MTAALGVVTLSLAPLAAACASGQSAAAGGGQGSGGATVSARTVAGSVVLVGPNGKTLYFNNQDRPGRPMCTASDCTAIWTPLTVQGSQPTAATDVTGKVATITLSTGSHQVTWMGMPLYTFAFDHSAGQDNGNGFHDSFNGTSFVWHAAMPQAQRPMQPSGSAQTQQAHEQQMRKRAHERQMQKQAHKRQMQKQQAHRQQQKQRQMRKQQAHEQQMMQPEHRRMQREDEPMMGAGGQQTQHSTPEPMM